MVIFEGYVVGDFNKKIKEMYSKIWKNYYVVGIVVLIFVSFIFNKLM